MRPLSVSPSEWSEGTRQDVISYLTGDPGRSKVESEEPPLEAREVEL